METTNLPIGLRFKLSTMMLLQFFIWGSWYVTMGSYLANSLKADGLQIGTAYGMMAIATIISPFFIGIIADRYFAPKKLLGLLHLLGACILFFITKANSAGGFNGMLLVYALVYAPTLSLSNSIAFDQLQGTGTSFAGIRVLGTLGWIVAGISIDQVFKLGPMALGGTFLMAAAASLALSLLSFVLPNRKNKLTASAVGSIVGSNAFSLFKNRSFSIFFVASILICIPLSFYYSLTNQFLNEVGVSSAASKMTYGQVSEAVFIVAIPFFLKRWGIKWMIAAGMVAWMARFILFGFGDAGALGWMLVLGILLHGICYDFFFVTGQMYTDSIANNNNRNAAQGMITMATYGLGMWIGSLVAGYVSKNATMADGSHQWKSIWMVPVAITAAVLVFFLVFFRERNKIISTD